MRIRPIVAVLTLVVAGAACEDSTEPEDAILGCTDIETIVIGETVSGALEEGDCVTPPFPVDYHRFELVNDTTAQITLTPSQDDPFRPVLVLFDDEEQELAREVASGASTVTITSELTAATYIIAVRTTSGNGSYTLDLGTPAPGFDGASAAGEDG